LTYDYYSKMYYNINFTCFFGMKDISELHCNTNFSSEFFYQLSQISCQQSLTVEFYENKNKEFISLQNNLKKFIIISIS